MQSNKQSKSQSNLNSQSPSENADLQYILELFVNQESKIIEQNGQVIPQNDYQRAFLQAIKHNRQHALKFIDYGSQLMVKLKKQNLQKIQIQQHQIKNIISQFIDPQILKQPLKDLIQAVEAKNSNFESLKILKQMLFLTQQQTFNQQKFINCLEKFNLCDSLPINLNQWAQM